MIKFTNIHGDFELKIGAVYNFDILDVEGDVYPVYNVEIVSGDNKYIELKTSDGYLYELETDRIVFDYEV